MKNKLPGIVPAIALLTLSMTNYVHASYVLPYPSYMPGSKLYAVSRGLDNMKAYWYWGTIASLTYHMGLADKYLVEAKTLFEYKQYLLASDALSRSNAQVLLFPNLVTQGEKEGKDMRLKKMEIQEELSVHKEVLQRLGSEIPADFLWQPERKQGTKLPLSALLSAAIETRMKIGQQLTP